MEKSLELGKLSHSDRVYFPLIKSGLGKVIRSLKNARASCCDMAGTVFLIIRHETAQQEFCLA